MAKAVASKELTSAQLLTGVGEAVLPKSTTTAGTTFYAAVRKMRKHPTVALARQLCIAPLLAAPWTIETNDGAPTGAEQLIEKAVMPLKFHLLKTSLLGCLDFGWQAYEKVFKIMPDSSTGIDKIKPLLQDITEINIDPATGSFNGVKNGEVTLALEETLLVNMEVEGTNWYGESFSAIVEKPYNEWMFCNDAAVRYDQKLAGAHWVIHYPKGFTMVDGVKTDNFVLAKQVVAALQSSGSIVVCKTVEGMVDGLNGDTKAWEIELKSAYPTANVAFIDRLKYQDALMARAYGLPERAVLEGQFGTKAEAEAHADFAITNMELRHQMMVLQYNWHLVNHLLRLNYGEEAENTVYLKVSPITDVNLQYLRQIYTTLLSNPETMSAEQMEVDITSLREQVGIPTKSNQEIAQDEQDALPAQVLSNFINLVNPKFKATRI